MARPDSERPMTDSQRDEIKRLCHKANIPDKSGELYTEETAQALLEDLREKASTVGRGKTTAYRHQ
jgi:transcription initiation factor TFIIIB Brf1 subunit/transcription initiation factor TFIIB